MKTHKLLRGNAASTAVVALIIISVGTLGLISMLGIVNARNQQVEASEEGFLRRIRELNGRQLAKEFLYRQVLPNSTGAATTIEWSYDNGDSDPSDDNWARIVVGSWNTSAFTTTSLGVVNQTSPGGDSNPYEVPVTISVTGNVTSSGAWDTSLQAQTYRYRVCGRNPALAGTLFGIHRSANGGSNQIGGTIAVNGASYVWETDSGTKSYSFSGLRSATWNDEAGGPDYLVTEIGTTDLLKIDGTPFLPWINNFPLGGAVSNDGTMRVTYDSNPNSLANTAINGGGVNGLTTNSNGVSSDPAGNVVIDLNDPSLPHVYIPDGAASVTFIGQTTSAQEIAAATMSPVVVAVKDSTTPSGAIPTDPDVVSISCQGNNTRPLIVGIIKGPSNTMDLQFTGLNWRMIYFSEDVTTTVSTNGGTVNLEGGVFTNREFIHSGGGLLNIVKEDAPSELDGIAPRWAWVEGYLQP